MAAGIKWQAQRSLAAASIGASYANVGTAFTVPGRCLFIDNLTNADLQISFDGGTTDNLVIAARSGKAIDVTTNKLASPPDDGPMQPVGTQVAVKLIGAAPGTFTGSIYVSYWSEIREATKINPLTQP